VTTISILILTKNEQQDLPGCLESVAWSDDIHVFDSGSTDSTLDIAKQYGATVTVRNYGDTKLAFGGDEGAHRTWGLRNIRFRHPWVFVIDADERMTPDLVVAVERAVSQTDGNMAFSVQRRDFFLDTWLKHVQTSAYYVRLFRPEKVHYERLINCKQVVDGPVASIGGYLDHYPFSKGMNQWLDRHNSYSRFEAEQIIVNRNKGGSFSLEKAFTAKDFHERRYHQKELFYRLPLRPMIKFLLLYIGKRGFLDGKAGLTYAMLQSIYEYFIVLKTRELEAQQVDKSAI
jgi:glycosyltransferase involved in cell wall biosynthesis